MFIFAAKIALFYIFYSIKALFIVPIFFINSRSKQMNLKKEYCRVVTWNGDEVTAEIIQHILFIGWGAVPRRISCPANKEENTVVQVDSNLKRPIDRWRTSALVFGNLKWWGHNTDNLVTQQEVNQLLVLFVRRGAGEGHLAMVKPTKKNTVVQVSRFNIKLTTVKCSCILCT